MGTFAETVIVHYHLLFADQGKPTSVFRFRLQQTNGNCHSLLVPFYMSSCVCVSIYSYLYLYLYLYPYLYGNVFIFTFISCLCKQKTEALVIFPNPFIVCSCANRSLSFVRLLMKKERKVIPFAKKLNGLNELAHL